MKTNTVIGTLSGISLDPEVPELWLARARVYRNPLWDSTAMHPDPSPNFKKFDSSRGSTPIAKFLIDVEFQTETDEIPGSLPSDLLQEAVLPLQLGTRGRVLVAWAKVGGGTRETVAAEGIPTHAPLPVGESRISILDAHSCECLHRLAEQLDGANLKKYEVPLGLFSDSFHRSRPIDRGIDLLVALESLFSEGPESISLKVALRACCLLATESTERKRIYNLVREAYRHRNTLVHGKRSKRGDAVQWFTRNCDELEDAVRMALCCFAKLSAEGNELTPDKVDDFLFDKGLMQGPANSKIDGFQPVGRLARLWKLL
ncbi:MAG TPA: hypothetical protein VMW67_01780 [Desulfobacteria bacterium]|nr:hypothetical protein [Desulfobacteria bacterium]